MVSDIRYILKGQEGTNGQRQSVSVISALPAAKYIFTIV